MTPLLDFLYWHKRFFSFTSWISLSMEFRHLGFDASRGACRPIVFSYIVKPRWLPKSIFVVGWYLVPTLAVLSKLESTPGNEVHKLYIS